MKTFLFALLCVLFASDAIAATYGVTVPAQATLTNRFLPYAGSGTQLGGNSPAWRESSGVLGINNYLEGLETLTPAAAVNLDFSTWRTKRITLDQNTVFTAINIPSASTNVQTMLLEVIGDGAFTVSFANVTFQTPEITTPEAGVVTLYGLRGDNGTVRGYTEAVAASGVTTINPTDGYLPYRSNATTFADSPFFQISTNAIGFYSTNQFIWQGGPTTLTVGYQAGASQLLGNNSVVIGPRAGEFADGAFQSVGLGNDVLRLSQAGDNTAIGHLVMSFAIGAADNTGVGFEALKDLTEGYDNTAIGTEALKDLTIGYDNTAIGIGALAAAITNIQLVALGSRALSDTLSGMRDTALGWHAGRTNVSGNDLTLIGYDANARTSADTNGIVIGANAVGNGSNTTVIGNTNTVSAHILASGYAGTGANFLSDDGTYKAGSGFSLWSSSSGNLTPSPAVDVVSIQSQSADNATNVALVVDTSSSWTSRQLVAFKSNGTNNLQITSDGSIYQGPNAQSGWGYYPEAAMISYRDSSLGDPKTTEVFWVQKEPGSGSTAGMQYVGSTNRVVFDLYTIASSGLEWDWVAEINTLSGVASLLFRDGAGLNKTVLNPGAASGSGQPAYAFRTRSALTNPADILLAVANELTNKFTVDFEGAITTGDPGGGTGSWKLGKIFTSSAVTIVATNFIQVTIDGQTNAIPIVRVTP